MSHNRADQTAKKSHSTEISQQREFTAKKFHCKGNSLMAKVCERSYRNGIAKRCKPDAKRVDSEETSKQGGDLTAQRFHSSLTAQISPSTKIRFHIFKASFLKEVSHDNFAFPSSVCAFPTSA